MWKPTDGTLEALKLGDGYIHYNDEDTIKAAEIVKATYGCLAFFNRTYLVHTAVRCSKDDELSKGTPNPWSKEVQYDAGITNIRP